MKLLPIGSIINIKEIDLIVLGYVDRQIDDKFEFYYLVSYYPIGYTGDKKTISSISIDSNYNTVFEGMKDKTSLMYLEKTEKRFEILNKTKPSEIEKLFDLINSEDTKNE